MENKCINVPNTTAAAILAPDSKAKTFGDTGLTNCSINTFENMCLASDTPGDCHWCSNSHTCVAKGDACPSFASHDQGKLNPQCGTINPHGTGECTSDQQCSGAFKPCAMSCCRDCPFSLCCCY
jgi:hypothetical protein